MKRIIFFSVIPALVLSAAGCHSSKQMNPPATVIINNADSVRTMYIETITIDTIIVEVPVPMESAKQVMPDSTSHLETSLAQSEAWINPDGTLGHSISNKPGKLNTEILVPQINKINEKESIKEREIPIPEPYPVEVERKWTLMEQIKLALFWYLFGAVIMSIGYIFRKPLLFVLRKIIRL